MAKYTKINQDTCIACGSCSAEAPDLFEERNDGVAYFILDENKGITIVPEEFEEDLDFAVTSCPTDSILVQETPFE